jgi:peptide-methionine (S)-S-oxide reductase
MIRLNRGGIMAGLGMVGALVLFIPRPGLASGAREEVAVFSGGCFWGVEAVFEHVKGVRHAESVRVVFDPSEVSYAQLLQVFFSVAHDPTQLNYQGPDHGPQYRSAIWYTSEAQKRTAEAYIAQLTRAHTFRKPIVTEVKPLTGFYLAEAYHQDYATRHPDAPYIVYNDAPKVEHLKQDLPALYRSARSS